MPSAASDLARLADLLAGAALGIRPAVSRTFPLLEAQVLAARLV
ncbi:hypothetical protein [Microbacterium sp. GCS4]|nr:hypothetical protein [Microbacterium sp. GCS4]